MKASSRLLTILPFLFLLSYSAQSQSWSWLQRAGGDARDEGEIVDVDESGNVVICGKFNDTAWFGNNYILSHGDQDLFIAKYDSSGTFQWARGAGGPTTDESVSVAFDPQGNIVVTGYFKVQAWFDNTSITGSNNLEFYVAKYSSSGSFQWVRKGIGPGDDRGKGIDCDSQGNILVTGSYRDTCIFESDTLISPGDDNIFLAKYSPTGNLLWILDGGGPLQAWTSTVSVDANDDAYITGSFKGTAFFGMQSVVSYGGNDVLLAKASSTGSWLWAVNGGGLNDDYGNGMEVDVFGNVAVTGSFFDTVAFYPVSNIISNGDKDGFIAYYNSSGAGLWANAMGGTQSDKGIACSTDKDGFVYVTGYVNGIAHFGSVVDTSKGGDDIFLAKYSPQGSLEFVELAGSTNHDYGKGIEVDDQGIVYIGGVFQNTMYFGNQTLVSAGDRDIFLVKYNEGLPLLVQQPQSQDVCVGDTVILHIQASGPGPFNYLWFDDAGSILGAVYDSYSFVCSDTNYSGRYYCHVGNSNGAIISDTAFITVHPLPLINFNIPDSTMFINDTLYIAIDPGYSSYSWTTGDTLYYTSKFFEYWPGMQGDWNTIHVTVTNEFGCEASDSIVVYIWWEGIPEYELGKLISIFPIPTNDRFYIQGEGLTIKSVNVRNIQGELILHQTMDGGNPSVDIKSLRPGIYFSFINTDKGLALKKIIKQ